MLTIMTNQKQRVTTSVLIETVERISKKNYIKIFRILVSFKMYHVELVDNEVEVSV